MDEALFICWPHRCSVPNAATCESAITVPYLITIDLSTFEWPHENRPLDLNLANTTVHILQSRSWTWSTKSHHMQPHDSPHGGCGQLMTSSELTFSFVWSHNLFISCCATPRTERTVTRQSGCGDCHVVRVQAQFLPRTNGEDVSSDAADLVGNIRESLLSLFSTIEASLFPVDFVRSCTFALHCL
jgi:hypothetical protein